VAHAVEHAAILHVGVFANADSKHVAADDGIHPDAGVFTDLHVTNNLSGLIDIARIMNAGRDSLIRAEHKVEFLKVTRAAEGSKLWNMALKMLQNNVPVLQTKMSALKRW
jgi:hypothetical protein